MAMKRKSEENELKIHNYRVVEQSCQIGALMMPEKKHVQAAGGRRLDETRTTVLRGGQSSH